LATNASYKVTLIIGSTVKWRKNGSGYAGRAMSLGEFVAGDGRLSFSEAVSTWGAELATLGIRFVFGSINDSLLGGWLAVPEYVSISGKF
jgi:hypothetical protein